MATAPLEKRAWRRLLMAAAGGLAIVVVTPSGGRAARSAALWHVVHGLCARDYALTRLPAPCLEVNPREGYAVVPDPKKRAHILLVPLRRVTGIEDPALLDGSTPNYWGQAWAARGHLEKRIGRPLLRSDFALAVNGIAGRSQDQLHIHISCVRPQVVAALAKLEPTLPARWVVRDLGAWSWRVRWIPDAEFAATDPFRLLAEESPKVRAAMQDQTLVAIPWTQQGVDGFRLLARGSAGPADSPSHGEALLDETCTAAAAEDSP